MNRNKSLVAAAVSIVTTLLAALNTTPASATVLLKSFKNYESGLCLDYRADWGVYVTGCNGGDFQKWYWNNHNAATPMRQKATGKCLMLYFNSVKLEECSEGEPLQWWWVQPNGPGQIPFIKSNYNGRCVQWIGGREVWTEYCQNGHGEQRWRVI